MIPMCYMTWWLSRSRFKYKTIHNTNNIFLCFQDIEVYLKLFLTESFLLLFQPARANSIPLMASRTLYFSSAPFFFLMTLQPQILSGTLTCPIWNLLPQFHQITRSYNLLAALNKEWCFCLLYIYLWNTSTWRQSGCKHKHMDWNFRDQVTLTSQPRSTLHWLNNRRHW